VASEIALGLSWCAAVWMVLSGPRYWRPDNSQSRQGAWRPSL